MAIHNNIKTSFFKKLLLSVLLILLGTGIFNFVSDSFTKIKNLGLIHWDSTLLAGVSRLSQSAFEVKKLVPPGSSIELSGNNRNTEATIVAFKYIIYPSEVRSSGQYYLDRGGNNKNLPASWRCITLSTGSKIYAKEGVDFEKQAPFYEKNTYFFIAKFALFLFAMFIIYLVGETILSGIYSATTFFPFKPGLFWYHSTAYLVGYIGLGALFWVYLLCGGPLTRFSVLFISCLVLILCFLFKTLYRKKFNYSALYEVIETDVLFYIKIIAAIFLMIYVLRILSLPIMVWDEMELWVLKAKVLFYHEQLDLHYMYRANYYPLLWPLNMALYFFFVGGDFEWVAKCASAVVFIAFIGQLWGGGRLLQLRGFLLYLFLFCYFLLFSHSFFSTALAENMYMALTLAFGTAVFMWVKTERKELFYLAMFLMLGLSLTKAEGSVVAIIFILFSLIFLRKRYSLFMYFLLFLPFIFSFAWVQWLVAHGYNVSVDHVGGFNSRNISVIWKIFLNRSVPEPFVWLILVALSSLVVINRDKPWNLGQIFLLFMGIGLIMFSLLSGLFWKPELLVYYPEVLLRLYFRCTPFIFMLWISRVLGYPAFEKFLKAT